MLNPSNKGPIIINNFSFLFLQFSIKDALSSHLLTLLVSRKLGLQTDCWTPPVTRVDHSSGPVRRNPARLHGRQGNNGLSNWDMRLYCRTKTKDMTVVLKGEILTGAQMTKCSWYILNFLLVLSCFSVVVFCILHD